MDMAEKSAMNSDNKVEQSDVTVEQDIKKEVVVKSEVHECLVCVNRDQECFNINHTKTNASGTSLESFLSRFTQTDLSDDQSCSKYVCKSCYELIDVLEQTELEYNKLKETFEAIISKNPLFDASLSSSLKLTAVKSEIFPDDDDDDDESVNSANLEEDSEDEPLIRSKRKRRKTQAKKKKSSTVGKRKLSNKNSDGRWECNVCGLQGQSGGAAAKIAHKLSLHSMDEVNPVVKDVKTEDSVDGSQSSFDNGFENCLRIGYDHFDDDSLSIQDKQVKIEKKRKLSSPRKTKLAPMQKMKKQKVMHQCDQCDSRYSTLTRLEQHKLKHDGSKPPYICEICGAHYKHKKACDIHIALHKGIGDWKCEECNRLFPSKNALQRHNNIHTGKLNYQCDLCGKSFIHTSSFKMHKLAHSGVKPHSCDVCGLALMTRSHLKRHKRIHSGEKRHECPICGKRFSERYNLAAHSKSHQQGEEAMPSRESTTYKRRFFRCNFCPERFERRYMLERHMSVVHGRTLERPPPTPRNTMSKLLKAQALTRRDAPPHAADTAAETANRRSADSADGEGETDTKSERSPESRGALLMSQKIIAQISSTTSIITAGSWSGAYAAEFGIRPDFPH